MKKLILKPISILFSTLFFLLLGFTTVEAQNIPLKYGDVIHLQNGWNKFGGGYLDTRGYQRDFEKTGNFLCVSTATESKRGGGASGSWKIMSAMGKPDGSPVLVDDVIHLFNQWNGNGGYLDTRGYQRDFEKTGNHLCVSTATVANRDSGSGTWRVTSATGKAAGTPVYGNSSVHLQNGWNRFQGGYLDTRGYQRDFEKTGNLLCVSTATVANRDGGSGIWKMTVADRYASSRDAKWKKMPGAAKQIIAGGTKTFVIGTDDRLYEWSYSNKSWVNAGRIVKSASVDLNNAIWTVEGTTIYRFDGSWKKMPGAAKQVSSGGTKTFVVGTDDQLYEWNYTNNSWMRGGVFIKSAAVDFNNTIWIVEGTTIKSLYSLN